MGIRIVIAEDIDLVAEAFQALLETEDDFKVVCRVSRGDALLVAVAKTMPDLVLADVDMPGMSGIDATAALRKKGFHGKVVLLTALPGSGHLHYALDAGANGYLLKSISGTRLKSAIRAVVAGRTAIDPDLAADALRTGPSPLTERELLILELVAANKPTSTIATELYLSVGTVRNYLSAAMSKLDADSRFEAVIVAQERGWMRPAHQRRADP